jgi:hypothetical protein
VAARRKVDAEHRHAAVAAGRGAEPIAYLRARQAEAEAEYAATGDPDALALVRAYEESLDGAG